MMTPSSSIPLAPWVASSSCNWQSVQRRILVKGQPTSGTSLTDYRHASHYTYPVADPGFGQGGAQLVRGAQL